MSDMWATHRDGISQPQTVPFTVSHEVGAVLYDERLFAAGKLCLAEGVVYQVIVTQDDHRLTKQVDS